MTTGSALVLHAVAEGGILGTSRSMPMSFARDVVVDGDYAYVTDGLTGIAVVDVRNPAAPVLVGREWSLGLLRKLAKSGDRLYASAGLFGVQVFDVSNPAQPRWVDNLMLWDYVEDVSAGGGVVVTTGLIDGLSVLDLAGERPKVVSRVPVSDWVEVVVIRGNTLQALTWGGVVQRVSLASPKKPERIGMSEAPGVVRLQTGQGYVVEAEQGLFGGVLRTHALK